MILLLALLLRDEFADQMAKLKAAANDPSAQYQSANALEKVAKPAHVPLLHKEIDAGPVHVRPHLIRVIGRVGGKEAVAALKALCQKHEIAARAEAAYQLKMLEDDSGMKLLAGMLAKAQTDDDKRQVLYKLYGFYAEGPDTVQALLKFLQTEKKDELRRLAIHVLNSHKDPAAAGVLRKLADDANDVMRYEAMAALIRTGDAEMLEEALKALEEDRVDLISAFQVLSAIESAAQKSALPRLRALLEKTESVTLKTSLIRTLAALKDDKAVPILAKLVEDKNESVAKAALNAMVELAGKGNLDLLKKLNAEGDPQTRLEAAEALLMLDNTEGYVGIKAVLEEPKSAYATQAVLLLGRIRRKESVDLLLPLLDDLRLQQYARQGLVQVLKTLFPYLKFDEKAPADKIKAWWDKHRPK